MQSEEYKEYEYLLKWKGYGEEENSWVPASSMNCWELLQAYLSKNIFNNPPIVSLATPLPLSNSASLTKRKTHSRSGSSKVRAHLKAKSKQFKDGSVPEDILAQHSTTPNGKLRLHLSESASITRRPSSFHPLRRTVEKDRIKKSNHFSTPKHLPSSSPRFRDQRPKSASSQSSRQKIKSILKQRKMKDRSILVSPSVSPLLSSCDDSSSLHSDGSISVDESFQLRLDSDEESNVSGNRSLSGETPLGLTEQPHAVNGHSPKPQLSMCSPQKKCTINGFNHSFLQEKNKVETIGKSLPNGHHPTGTKKLHLKKNGIVRHAPTSTTQSTTENSSDSESWSRRRLRKRVHSSSPTPSLELVPSSGLSSTGSGGHGEVSSTTSSLNAGGYHTPAFAFPPTPPPTILQMETASLSSPFIAQSSSPATVQVSSLSIESSLDPVVPQPLSPSNPEYQQELLEWQFELNQQCRKSEAFILVENRIDEAPIPWSFKYITRNMYGEGVPDPQNSEVASTVCGCNCYLMGKKCGPKNQYCCPKMAGAEFPYSLAGKIRLPPGNPIYECNSRCNCPQDCTNRVVQRGRKINMCIFRTSNGRGWGVKTMEPIKPNTFVTEYVGEVVTTEEAERRGELYDQEGRTYLFDLDFSCDDNAFTIDAAHYGNISHFFNHSVSLLYSIVVQQSWQSITFT